MPDAGRRRETAVTLRCVTLADLALSGETKRFAGGGNAPATGFAGGGVDQEVRGPVIGEEDELVRTHADSVTKGV